MIYTLAKYFLPSGVNPGAMMPIVVTGMLVVASVCSEEIRFTASVMNDHAAHCSG